ncbi:MAG TPA: zinc-dependent alcohol dehydrogenase [Solirubrobacteraceae bacterium]|nr:zinc-dependent alcohol dehydrogenase [Solirubrobacteraceae bacterium]
MKAVVFHGKDDLRVDTVPDPKIEQPTDAIIKVTSSAICGSDLHLFGDYVIKLEEGDILGHEPMGIVEEVGPEVTHIAPGDRVVIPFNISCGSCFMCDQDLYSQCETTGSREHGKGAALFGYTHLYGGVPGGQAEYLRVPQAHFGPIKVDHGPPDERFLFLSDVLPTAWQAVVYADTPKGGTLGVWGLGPIGQMCVRIGRHLGAERVIGVDFVPERLEMAKRWGAEVVDVRDVEDAATAVNEMTGGRGCDAVIDAVGMESGDETFLAKIAQRLMIQADRLEAFRTAQGAVRRGGTLSLSGVYLGLEQNFPLGDLFDRQIQIRMGQANVRRWTPEILPLLTDEDPLGTEDLVTHRLPLEQAPHGYDIFREKEDGAIKVVLDPTLS